MLKVYNCHSYDGTTYREPNPARQYSDLKWDNLPKWDNNPYYYNKDIEGNNTSRAYFRINKTLNDE